MTSRSFLLTDALDAYVLAHTAPPDDVVADLVEQTRALGAVAGMQIGLDQATFLTALTAFAGVRTAVEVGTFTGLSALHIARGLADGGRLLCCDVDEAWTAMARQAWARAGVEDRIDLRIAPAAQTLAALPPDPVIDLAFIDADKPGYVDYFELLVPRLRAGGVILADNTLWSGNVVDEGVDDANTVALRRFNDHVAADPRVRTTILSIGDGVTLCQRLD